MENGLYGAIVAKMARFQRRSGDRTFRIAASATILFLAFGVVVAVSFDGGMDSEKLGILAFGAFVGGGIITIAHFVRRKMNQSS